MIGLGDCTSRVCSTTERVRTLRRTLKVRGWKEYKSVSPVQFNLHLDFFLYSANHYQECLVQEGTISIAASFG
jgi:hypothetical protein